MKKKPKIRFRTYRHSAKFTAGEWIWAKFLVYHGIIIVDFGIYEYFAHYPGLDGGFVLFTLIEMIIGRKLRINLWNTP